MPTLGSGVPSPAAAVDTGSHWVPHGPVLTACVVSVNVLAILLNFFLFWRFLFGKEEPSTSAAAAAAAAEEDEDDSPPVASPWASRWRQQEDLGAPPLEDVASALPVYIYSSAGDGEEGGKQHAGECAVCIVELRDGEPARRVQRCGHQFHADCVGTWLRLHATCPLCRASVVAAPAAASAAAAAESRNAKEEDNDVAVDCPV